MARRRASKAERCSVRDGLTIADAKRYWNRPGPGHGSRQRTQRGADWERRGNKVAMFDRDDNRTTFTCEGGRIVARTDYVEDLPSLTRSRRRTKRRRVAKR
jgi:hypothetical protein